MDTKDDIVYKIGLSGYRNMNLTMARHLEECNISPFDFFTRKDTTLSALSKAKAEYFSDERRKEALIAARREKLFIDEFKHIGAAYYTDAAYPQRLLECGDAPAMIYYAGEINAANSRHVVSIVGTRHCTAYGADFTRRLIADLASKLDDLTVISGLAYGVDITAHRAAMDCGIPTGAILAHGLNTVYPAEHRKDASRIVLKGGFVATEYTSQSAIHRGNFLARNRIVAGMSDVTIIIESDIHGGAMATARMASDYNREVMALPGRINDTYSRGCNALIASNGAVLLRDADDIISLMGWQCKPSAGEQSEIVFDIPESYRPILSELERRPDSTVNDLCVALGIPFSQLTTLLFRMEMDDFIMSLPGGRYATTAKVNS